MAVKKSTAKAPKKVVKFPKKGTELSKWNGTPTSDMKPTEIQALMREVSEQAEKIAHLQVVEQCERAGITIPRILQRISEALDAKEVKTNYSSVDGDFVYSKQLVAWNVRQKAVDQAVSLLGIKAPETSSVTMKTTAPPTLILDFSGNAGDNEE
ncbi:MAG: hypothetical protein ABFD07_10030 [Methanobacterium sp.]